MKPPLDTYRISSGFGWRIHPIRNTRRFHTGNDMAAQQGTPIYPFAVGVVEAAGYGETQGNCVRINHGDWGNGEVVSEYLHMMSKPSVVPGQAVSEDDVLGYVGSTGLSTGPHLHFNIRIGDVYIDPMKYILTGEIVKDERGVTRPITASIQPSITNPKAKSYPSSDMDSPHHEDNRSVDNEYNPVKRESFNKADMMLVFAVIAAMMK